MAPDIPIPADQFGIAFVSLGAALFLLLCVVLADI